MKIKKQATSRHESTLSPMIADFVKATSQIPIYQLPKHLASFPKQWPFPRGDTYHWIPVLNRFDRILELFNEEYGLVDGPQTQPFERRLLLKGDAETPTTTNPNVLDELHITPDGDRLLIEQILNFTRLLLENCGNRSLYNSSGHLDKLLNTTSVSLVKATLRLALRLAQRYNAARMRLNSSSLYMSLLSSHYSINLDKVQKLAAPFAKSPGLSPPIFATPVAKGKEKASADRSIDNIKVNPADMLSLFALPDSSLNQELGGVSISYYVPTPTSDQNVPKSVPSTESPATPTPARSASNVRSNQTPHQPQSAPATDSPITPGFTPGDGDSSRPSGPKFFELSAEYVEKTDIHEILRQGMTHLPETAHYELLHKLRIARTFGSGNRQDAVALRMLGTANLGYVLNERDFYTRIGQQDSDEPRRLQLAYQLSELVQPPGPSAAGVSTELQTLALNTLEALAKHKSKAPDVCTALSVNVNHGILFYVVRKLVAELGTEDDDADGPEVEEWREALFSLLNTLPTSQVRTGEGMVAAGLLEILVEVLKLRTEKAERNHPKVLNFLDTFVHNLRDAFNALASAKGIDIMSDLMSYEVEVVKSLAAEDKGMPAEYKTQLTDYQIPFHNQQTLRWLFKFLNHIMSHSSGNFERLMRTLIDSPQLLGGVRTVLEQPTVYGSTVWSMAVNILTSFIHNEPTSYAVIAEANLSKAFLETVSGEPISEESEDMDEDINESSSSKHDPKGSSNQGDKALASGILPVAEAISTLPTAFGAICLAESGMKLFKSSTALKRFFEIFESPAHVKALDVDTEIPKLIGNSFDELVRHHPVLKERVLSCLSGMITRVVQLCSRKAQTEGIGAKLWIEGQDGTIRVAGGRRALLGADGPGLAQGDVDMKDADEAQSIQSDLTIDQVSEVEDPALGPTTGQYINVLCRFLSGFFTNHGICGSYIEAGGVESVLDIATLPCLDINFKDSRKPRDEFGEVVQALVEQKPHIAVPALVKRTQQTLDCLDPLTRCSRARAFFAPFTHSVSSTALEDPEDEETLAHGTSFVKSLVALHTLLNALTLTFQNQIFHPRNTLAISSQVNLTDMYARLVESLGKLHRSCVWEEILLQKDMPAEWEKATRVKSSGFGISEADHVFRLENNDQSPSPIDGSNSSSGENAASATEDSTKSGPSQRSARFKNIQTLRFLLSKIPTGIAPFFQSLGKIVLFRRSPDAYQKQCAFIVSDQLAQAVIDQLQFYKAWESESVEDCHAYWIIILTSLSQLMMDNTSPSPSALTLVLVSFRNLGGLTVLASILDMFFERAQNIVRTQGNEVKEESQRLLNLSLGGIKIILAFYSQIINAKVISEASQSQSMQGRPTADTKSADYFLCAQFLVELRHAVIRPLQKIWSSELMDKATTSIVKTSINILKGVLEGEGEHGAYKSVDKIPTRPKPIIKPWKPRSLEHLNRLKEDDNSENLAEEALYRCNDNLNLAKEYCKNQKQARSSRNPIPQYEMAARGPPSSSPSRAEVVVPEPADPTVDSGEGEDTEANNSQSVEMEGVEGPSVSDTAGYEESTTTSPQDGLAYQKRMATGNTVKPVAVEDLDEERAKLRQHLIDRSLDVLNSHDDVTFELADLITATVSKAQDPAVMRAEIGTTLVQSLVSLQTGDDLREHGKKIAASAHLLALVIQENEFYEAIVEELKGSFSFLLQFIKVFPDQTLEESSPWIAQVLLIIERLLAEDQLPPQIQWTPPSGIWENQEEVASTQLPEPIVNLDEKHRLFDAILELLPRIGKNEAMALSVTRVLVMLTRTRVIATRLSEKRNIQRLFLMIKQLSGITNESLRSSFMIILRHIIEDDAMLRQIMRTEIQQMFESRDRRNTDTTTYTRQMYASALRSPELFVEVTNEKLQLSRFDPHQRPQALQLKKDEFTDEESNAPSGPSHSMDVAEEDRPKQTSEQTKQPVLERTKTSDLKLPVVDNSDGVIHYLLCELLAYKEVDDKLDGPKAPHSTEASAEQKGASNQSMSSSSDSSANPSTSSSEQAKAEKTSEKTEFKAESHPIYIYRCFILKCLAELLQSYNRTKIEFINFSRKADPHSATPSKPRSGVLNYFLNGLVPVGSLNHEGDLTFKKKVATSNCAIDVLVSLCAKTGEHNHTKQGPNAPSPYVETESELLFVRKFVLEHALKAFKDAASLDEPLEMKYSRLLNIADVFSKMVSQRPNGEMLNPNSELTPNLKQMAKIMYEKNFITILTTAIADIDLNFPNAKRVVKYILKPLKWLCFVAMDLSTKYDTSTPDSADEYEISSATDDDVMDDTREETPDLFRNSTLGMFEPHESESEPSDDDDDEEMYGDAYADDMEFDEDVGDEDVVSDDDESMDMDMEMEMGEMGPIEGLPGDVDLEIELDDEGEGVGSDEGSEEEDDENDEEDEDEGDEEDEDEQDMELEDMEEITGDDENASLAEDREDSWSGDGDDFPGSADVDPNSLPGLGFVIDHPHQLIDQMHQDGDIDDFMEEDMHDDEEEDEEEDYDEGDIVYDAGLDDEYDGDQDMTWPPHDPVPIGGRGPHPPRGLSPWMFPGGPSDRIILPAYRSHSYRSPMSGPRMTDDGVNPLLQRGGRGAGREGAWNNVGRSDWVHAIEGRGPRFLQTESSPVSFISNLLNVMSQGGTLHQHNGALHFSVHAMPGMTPPTDPPGFRRDAGRSREGGPLSRSAREDPNSSIAFTKANTSQRWQEEAKILYGPGAIEKSQRIINSLLKIMVPPAIEIAKKRHQEREAEAERKLKEEMKQKEEQERKARQEQEERETKEREERERADREAAEAAARAAEDNTNEQTAQEPASTSTADTQAMEGVEAAAPTAEQPNEPAEAARPRITTTLRGREYDITDLGIDMEYLEALPEDMREEVLLGQVQERRAQRPPAQTSGEQPSDIDQDFLHALPPEIREELLQQEAQDRRRREREEARRRSQANGPSQPEEMDPASFLASLDPNLRQAVLMDQSEEVLSQLPREIADEARTYGGDRRLNQLHDYLPPGYRRGTDRRTAPDDQSQKKKARPCVQMLDKAGVATLLRLMFIPQQGSAKTSLSSILRYVCENRQNRAEVISILLSILQDGSVDVNAVERSFAQLSLRAKQSQQASDKTPKASRKNGALSINSDVSPLMVVQQCLNTLTQLTEKNPAVWSFFLTEHETGVGFKSRGNRKGKAKETKSTRYPLNALLSLLDRKLIIESSSIMEQLTTLLRVITVPLQAIKKEKEKEKETSEAQAKAEETTGPTAAVDNENGSGEQTEASTNAPQQSANTETATAPEAVPQTKTITQAEGSSSKTEASKEEEKSKKHRSIAPPDVPENNLRLVAKILAARECNSKVFQETLSVISNLSPIPGAKEIFGQELLGIAQDLARSTLEDLASLTTQVSHAASPTDVQGIALSKFSPATSDQTKLLRALTALDYLFDPTRDNKDKAESSAEALEPAQKDDILLTLYEDAAFAPLWNKLSECLTVIRQRGNMLNIATTLLPLIETLMVVCKNTTLRDAPLSKMLPKEFTLSSPPPESKMEDLFFTFTEDHRKILNDLVRQNPKLMSGTFSLLVKNSKVLEFDNKRNYFNRKLHARARESHHPHPPLQLAVRRDHVFLDSFKALYFKTADEMKYGKLSIRFHGEEGVDAGGVTREWFQVIARQMFNPDYALFVPVASDRTTFHPNRLSEINPEHLMFFKFIGRVIGKALYENRVLDCHFSRAVYKCILGRPVNLKDMETLDLEYYKSLVWMLENDITDIITETFSTEVEAFGVFKVIDLVENGRNIPVTEENKHEYVRLVTEHRLTGSVNEQLEHFLKGFHDVVPAELVSIFSEQELELLISGLPDINVDDWKNNTEYHNYTAASPQIQWFWRAVRTFEKEEQAKLLQFVTGTSKVPLNGFKELEGMNGFSRFNIHRDFGSKDRLPSSHTCFNQLDLPEYESYEDLRKGLYTAMTAGGEYFGFA